jgi:hypothetical protein
MVIINEQNTTKGGYTMKNSIARVLLLLVVAMVVVSMSTTAFGKNKAKKPTAAQVKSSAMESLTYVLEHTKVSGYPTQKVTQIDEKNFKYQAFDSVERVSSNGGVKYTMVPVKVAGGGIVNLSGIMQGMEGNMRVEVTYKIYVYFNDTNDLKWEEEDVKVISSQQI